MNTFAQDTSIPIYIMLKYENNAIKFPVNPESLSFDTPSGSETEDVLGLGQVSDPGDTELTTVGIESFFWHQVNLLPAAMYVSWLNKWQKSKKPATLIVTRLNYSMQVTCEGFRYWINAGEEEDTYFSLQMKEYKPHGARYLQRVENKTLLERYQSLLDAATPPVLIEVPRPARGSSLKESVGNTFTAISGYDTLCAIARKQTGSSGNWKELYEANKENLGNLIMDGGQVPIGTVLTMPATWTGSGLSSIAGA